MNDNFEKLLFPQIEEIINSFTSNLEGILEDNNGISQNNKKDILKDLLDIIEVISPYQDVLKPQINGKINHIKRLLETSNDVVEGEEHPINTPPLSDVQ